MAAKPDLRLIYNQMRAFPDNAEREVKKAAGLAEDPGGPHDPAMTERISRLEGGIDGVKQSQTILIAAAGFFGAVLILLAGYTALRVDRIEDKMEAGFTSLRTDMQADSRAIRSDMQAEARATRAELAGIANAIASSITAAKDQRPVIINVPPAPTPAQQ